MIRVHFCTDSRINFVIRYNHESATMRQPNQLQKHLLAIHKCKKNSYESALMAEIDANDDYFDNKN